MSKYQDIEQAARQHFADANGWRIGKWFAFRDLVPPGILPRGVSDGDIDYGVLVDHGECYRQGRKPVAIVGHNYDGDYSVKYGTEKITDIAEQHGLVVHIAPAGKAASWYYPNHATLLVITRPGIEIVWPTPQQMVAHAMTWAVDYERRRTEHTKRLAA
jgi:hypothetical protein